MDQQREGQKQIFMINSVSLNIYKTQPLPTDKVVKQNSQAHIRQTKQFNNIPQSLLPTNSQNQKEQGVNNLNQSTQKQKQIVDQPSTQNQLANFRISQSTCKSIKSKSITNNPLANQNHFQNSFIGNNDYSQKRDLRSMIGLSYQAAQGYENICEQAYTKSKIDQLKFNSQTSQKLMSNLKSEIQKQSKIEFQQSYSQKQQPNSNSFYNFDNETPQKSRNASQIQYDSSINKIMNGIKGRSDMVSHKLNKSDLGLVNSITLDSKFSQNQSNLNTEKKRLSTKRGQLRLQQSQQITRKKTIDGITDMSVNAQSLLGNTQGIKNFTEAVPQRKNQLANQDGTANNKNGINKNINEVQNATQLSNTLNNTTSEQGFQTYNQNKMAAMISRDNSMIINQSLQLLNSLRKKNYNFAEEKSPEIKFKQNYKGQSLGSTQYQTRQHSQHQEHRHQKNISAFTLNQQTLDSTQDQQILRSPNNQDNSIMNKINQNKSQFNKQPTTSCNNINPQKKIMVSQFLKDKNIDSKDWPKLREKIFYTLQMKGYTAHQEYNDAQNKTNNNGIDKIKEQQPKQSVYNTIDQQQNDNQIQLFQQNILIPFLENKEQNNTQQIGKSIQPSSKSTIDYKNSFSFKKSNNINNKEERIKQQLDQSGQTVSINKQLIQFNDQINQTFNQVSSIENTPINKGTQNNSQLNINFNSSNQTPKSSQSKKKKAFKLDFAKLNQPDHKQSIIKSFNKNEDFKSFSARNFSASDLVQIAQQHQQQQQNTPRKNITMKSARYTNDKVLSQQNTPINSSYFKGAGQIVHEHQRNVSSKIQLNDTTPTGNKVKKSMSLLSSTKINTSTNKHPSFKDKVNAYNENNFINHLNSVYDNVSQGSPSNSQQNNEKSTCNSFINTTSKSNFFKHSIMNSLCLIQLKKIKQKVTEEEKQRLQNFFDGLIQTQDLLKYQKDTPIEEIAPEYKLHQMKYIPRGNQDIFENKNLRKVYRDGIKDPSPQHKNQPSTLSKVAKDKEEYKKVVNLLSTQKEYNEDKDIVKLKEQDLKQEIYSKVDQYAKDYQEKIPSLLKITSTDLISPNTKQHFEFAQLQNSKWQKMRRGMIEFLERIHKLNLSMDDVVKYKLFSRAPYSRQGSQEFFELIKANDYKQVVQFLLRDKYLVYTYDNGMNTPLQLACKRGNTQIAQKLIEYNSDLDHTNLVKKTALYYACRSGDIQTAILLLKNKANPWSQGKCSLNTFIDNFQNKKQYFQAAKRIHFMMNLVPLSKKQKIWDEFQYLFNS